MMMGAAVEKYCWLKSAISLRQRSLPGLRFERYQVVVRRDHVDGVVPHADAAVGDRRAAARAPEVVPQLPAVARVERPRVVGRRHVKRAVHHERGALDVGRHHGPVLRSEAADHDGRAAAAHEGAALARPVPP